MRIKRRKTKQIHSPLTMKTFLETFKLGPYDEDLWNNYLTEKERLECINPELDIRHREPLFKYFDILRQKKDKGEYPSLKHFRQSSRLILLKDFYNSTLTIYIRRVIWSNTVWSLKTRQPIHTPQEYLESRKDEKMLKSAEDIINRYSMYPEDTDARSEYEQLIKYFRNYPEFCKF